MVPGNYIYGGIIMVDKISRSYEKQHLRDEDFIAMIKPEARYKKFEITGEDLAALLLEIQFQHIWWMSASAATGHNVNYCWNFYKKQIFVDNLLKIINEINGN